MPIARGMQAAAGTSPIGGFFGALSKGIREEKERRDKKDAQLLEVMQLFEKIERETEIKKQQAAKEQQFELEKIRTKAAEERETKRLFPAKPTKITGTDIKTAAGLGVLERGAPTAGERVLGMFQHLIPGAQATEKRVKRFGEAQEEFGEVSPELRRGFLGQFGGQVAPRISRKIRVRVKSTGQTGTIEEQEFDPNIYERI